MTRSPRSKNSPQEGIGRKRVARYLRHLHAVQRSCPSGRRAYRLQMRVCSKLIACATTAQRSCANTNNSPTAREHVVTQDSRDTTHAMHRTVNELATTVCSCHLDSSVLGRYAAGATHTRASTLETGGIFGRRSSRLFISTPHIPHPVLHTRNH
jgi:hypothetical protein